jgi:Fe-S-cluster containining protein
MNDARYLCQRCGNCCRWPGFVSITVSEARRIADFLGMTAEAFAAEYTELLPSRGALGIRSLAGGACVFLEGKNHCRIQSVKPLQCKGFPNAWRFPGWRDLCEALETPTAQLENAKCEGLTRHGGEVSPTP